MSLKDFTRNRWVKLGFWALLYTAWVIWLGNYWWLFGLIIIFDLLITKKTKKQKRNLDHFSILEKDDLGRVKELLVM